jgi:hypothetical protein
MFCINGEAMMNAQSVPRPALDPKLLQSVRAGAYQNLTLDFLYNGTQWWADPEDDAPTWEGDDVLRAFDVVLAEVAAALGINRQATAEYPLPAQD